jgi:hypothetical protein
VEVDSSVGVAGAAVGSSTASAIASPLSPSDSSEPQAAKKEASARSVSSRTTIKSRLPNWFLACFKALSFFPINYLSPGLFQRTSAIREIFHYQ